MIFQDFSEVADDINNESSNNEMARMVAELISNSGDDISIVPRFVQGQIFPRHGEQKVNMSTSLLRTAISESTGVEEDELKETMPEVTDLGELFDVYDIEDSGGQSTLSSSDVTVGEVYDVLSQVAETSGSGSQQEKIDYIVSLVSRCSSLEAKYLVRLILGKMSIGVGEGTVRKAIAQQYDVDENIVERAVMLNNDTGHVAEVARENGGDALEQISITVGEVPLRPMKASKSEVSEVFEEVDCDSVYGEYKYDGFRIQAHKDGNDVTLFTRRLENVTDSLPDVVEIVRESVDAEEAILDGEIVGYESKDYETPLSYQKTQQRIRRKYGIDEMVDEIPIQPAFFDVLYYGNEGLVIDEELEYRVELLESACGDSVLGERVVCSDVKDLQDLMAGADEDGHEGGMAKVSSSTYEPNSRGKRWLKLKPSGETIDAVVIGGEYGDGRRSDFVASYELALWNEDADELESIGDVGTGFTDKEFAELTDMFEDEVEYQDGREIRIRPTVVFEVRFEEVQPSPKYESGFGLRFPTFERVRETKGVDDADTIERLQNIGEDL